jgi:hypothetical protein
MGVLLILLGLIAAGVLADFLVENDLATAPDQAVGLFGGSFRLSTPEVVLGGAVLGALSVLLVILGRFPPRKLGPPPSSEATARRSRAGERIASGEGESGGRHRDPAVTRIASIHRRASLAQGN